MSLEHPPQPTTEQCNDHATWVNEAGFRCRAFWWPQMGGYCARAIVQDEPITEGEDADNGCLIVWVWHDGAFPFHDDSRLPDEPAPIPARLHLCDAEQWLHLGRMLVEFDTPEGEP